MTTNEFRMREGWLITSAYTDNPAVFQLRCGMLVLWTGTFEECCEHMADLRTFRRASHAPEPMEVV